MDIKDITAKAGGPVALSRALGLSRGAVSQWDMVPPERVLAVCRATNWACTPHDVRSDLYPNPTDALPELIGSDGAPAVPAEAKEVA